VTRVAEAVEQLTADGRRVTKTNVAEIMNRHERTLHRDLGRHGFPSWLTLRRTAQASLLA
jgi:hypothetical protein